MSSELMLNGMVDQRGLTRQLSSQEMDKLAEQIGTINEVVDLAAGDLINQKCVDLGIPKLTTSFEAGKKLEFFPDLEQFVHRMGYTMKTAAELATVARAWPRADRAAGLGFHHYKAVQGMKGDARPQAIAILKEAQMGYQKPDGSWVKPHPVAWVKKKRAAVEGNGKKTLELKNEETIKTSTLVPKLEQKLRKKGLSERDITTTLKEAEKEIGAHHKSLLDSYNDQVHKEALEKSKEMRERAAKVEEEAKAEQEKLSSIYDGVNRTLRKEEFKYLRQFCHPDRHPGNEEKAEKAMDIVNRIGKRLHFSK